MEWTKADYERLGDHIVSARVAAGLDRTALAAKADISGRTLADIENGDLGKRKSFSVETLEGIGLHIGWAPGSWRKVLNGVAPELRSQPVSLIKTGPEGFTDAQLLAELTRRQKKRDLMADSVEQVEQFVEAKRASEPEAVPNGLAVGAVQSGKTANFLVILQKLIEDRERAGLPPLDHQVDMKNQLSRVIHAGSPDEGLTAEAEFDLAWTQFAAGLEASSETPVPGETREAQGVVDVIQESRRDLDVKGRKDPDHGSVTPSGGTGSR